MKIQGGIHRSGLVAVFVLTVVLATVSLAGCGGKSGSSSSTTTSNPTAGAPAPTNPIASRKPINSGTAPIVGTQYALVTSFQTGIPDMDGNFADPFILIEGTTAYAYATNVTGANIPVAELDTTTQIGEFLGDALPTLPSWSTPGYVWAPSVYNRGDGTYVMFYDTIYGYPGHQCIGAATSTSPKGPFVDNSSAPLVCPLDLGGAIDASMITVNGASYLIYKSDGNCCSLPTTIFSQQLSPDLLSVTGTPTALIRNDQTWEADVVEGPEMIQIGNQLWLFYSGNDWNTANYGVGYAKCASVTGPCTKPLSTAFFSSTPDAVGTGGETFIVQGEKAGMAYHGWLPGQVNTPTGERRLYVGAVEFSTGLPVLSAYK